MHGPHAEAARPHLSMTPGHDAGVLYTTTSALTAARAY
jgi:hypothetical protein